MEGNGHQYGLGLTLGRMDERLGTIQHQLRSQRETLSTIEHEIISVRSAIIVRSKDKPQSIQRTLAGSLEKGDLKSIVQVIGLVIVVIITTVAQMEVGQLRAWIGALL